MSKLLSVTVRGVDFYVYDRVKLGSAGRVGVIEGFSHRHAAVRCQSDQRHTWIHIEILVHADGLAKELG